MNGERAKERILVVDDEPTVVRMCAKALSRQGYQVSEVGRGREALARLEEEQFDLLLLDLLLPDVDGLTVLRQARELDPHVTAVIITGYGTIETAVNALRAGARGFLLKPFESGELLQAVDEALAERRQEQENLLLRARLPILEISQTLMAEEDVGSLAGQLLETVVRQVEADRAALMLLDEQTDELRIVGIVGLPAGAVDGTREPVVQGITRQVLLREEPLVVDREADLDPSLQALVAGADAHIVCVPLRTRKEAMGVLVLGRSSERVPFTSSDLDLLSIVGNQMAIALENARLFEIVAQGKREWETTFDAMTDWVCLVDLEGRILRTNRAGEELTGVPLAKLMGQTCCQFIHGTERPIPGCILQKMRHTHQQETTELQSPDGDRWLRVTVDPVTDEEGNLIGAAHVVRDITARILAEEELHRLTEDLLLEKEKLEDIVRGVGAGLALLDLETRIVWANEILEGWFGPLEEIAGRACCELYELEDPQEECIALHTLHSGQMEHGETFAHDVQGERRYFQLVTMPLRDKDGEITQIVELTLDITARQQAEEALRESEQKFRSVIEQSSDGIALIDELGTIIEWNRGQEQIFGLPRAEALGQPAWAVHEQLKASVLELLRTGQVSQLDRLFEREIQRPDGQRRVVQTLVFPIEVDQRVMIGSVSRDITDLKWAEEALERRAAQLALLNDVGGRIAATLDLDDVLNRAASLVQESFGYHHVALFTVDRQRGELVMRARAGDFAHLFPPDHRLALGQGIVGWVSHHGETLLVSDVDAEPRYVNLYPDQVPTRSELSVPIRVAGEIVGVLDVQSSQLDAFDENDVLVMETLADQVAVALENARLFEVVARGKREWETTFDAMTDWVCLLDLGGRVLRTNRVGEKFAGVSLAGIVGQKCCKLVHNSENPLPECPLQRMCQTHQRESLKFQVPNGNRWLMAAVDPVTDAEGNLIGAVYTIRDVTERERAEQELHLLATMVEQSTDSIIHTDTAFRITYVNKATEELFGWRLDELRGKTPDLFNAEPLADEIQARIYTTVAAGGTYQDEALNVRKDGSTFHCQFRVSPLYDESGAIYGYMGSQRDVTARKRAEEELRTLSSVVEQSASAIAIIDLEGNVEYANPTFLERNDFSPEQIVGQNWRAFLSTSSSLRERYPEIQDTVVQRGALWREEITDRAKGSEAIWREATIFPIKDANGAITHSVYASVDITARKQAEEALKRRNEELAALNAIVTAASQYLDLDDILDAALRETLAVLNAEGGLIFLFDETSQLFALAAHRGIPQEILQEVTGFQLAEGLSGQVAQTGQPLLVHDLTQDPRSAASAVVREGWRSTAIVPLKAKEGTVGVMTLGSYTKGQFTSESLDLLTSIGRQIGMAVESARLVEEAAEIEILRELDRLRSEIIANVSHELRTPLGLIKVFSTILLSEDVDLDSETQRECLQNIDEETDRLEAIVDNLLDLSRLRDERLRLDKHPTDLGRLAREVVESMEVQLTHHRLVLDFPAAPLMATVDPGRIAQVLRNLLDNAVKYSPEGGTITVQGRAEDEQRILVGISDEGIGIPTQELEKVFERFHRVENEVTQHVRGAGLGLAVCRGIVAAHDGHIWAESTLGVGSTFYFTLPVGAESVIS